MTLFERYEQLNIDASYIGLEKCGYADYFCDPVGVRTFAGLGVDGVHFAFIDGFSDMVFAISPYSVNDKHVNPLAYTFEDFLGLVLACKNSNPLEEIYWQSRSEFYDFLDEDMKNTFEEQEAALSVIRSELKIEPIKDPYEYVKKVQADFDYSKIEYSDEYYDTLGISRE